MNINIYINTKIPNTDTNIDIITEKKNKGSLYWFKCTGEYKGFPIYKFGMSHHETPFKRINSYSGLCKPENNVILLAITKLKNQELVESDVIQKLRKHPNCRFHSKLGREYHICDNETNVWLFLRNLLTDKYINSLYLNNIKSITKLYICPECNNRFSTKRRLEDHSFNVCYQKKEWKCSLCNDVFISNRFLQKHQTICELRKCPNCNYKTPKKKQLEEHIKSGICTRLFKCHICFIELKSRNYLKTHYKKKHNFPPDEAEEFAYKDQNQT